MEFHVQSNGQACVLLPDERFRVFPEGTPFLEFLNRPVLSFFLGQSLRSLGEDWPFGEWGHGVEGIWELYRGLFGTDERKTIAAYLKILSKQSLKEHWDCPCGSGKRLRKCHRVDIMNLRQKIPPQTASQALERLGLRPIPKRCP